MLADLIRIETRDGLFLDAGLQRASVCPPRFDFDAVCLIHGTGGNFYSSTLFDLLAQRFLAAGCAVLRANTRGHDGISTAVTGKGGIRLGAAYEKVDDCRHDLAAFVDYLEQNVGPRVALLGHSLGAVKCLYAAANEAALGRVARIIALSPPRLSYEWFCSSSRRAEFLETYRLAEEKVAQGEPLALLDVKMPLPFVISAAGYVEKYGPEERYNFARSLPAVNTRTLFLFGGAEVENNVAFQGAPALIEERRARFPHLAVATIPGGDHFYTGVRDVAWNSIERWLTAS